MPPIIQTVLRVVDGMGFIAVISGDGSAARPVLVRLLVTIVCVKLFFIFFGGSFLLMNSKE
jgi:hypothetical protein